MTIEELKNSDFVKMKNRETKRHVILATIVALLIICVLVYCLKPRHFNNDIFMNNNLVITYSVDSIHLNKDGVAITDVKTKKFDFSRESKEFHQIQKILTKYSYHICFNTLKGILSTVIDGSASVYNGYQTIWIYTVKDSIMIANVPYIIVEGNVYRIGYFGSSKISEFNSELKDILNVK